MRTYSCTGVGIIMLALSMQATATNVITYSDPDLFGSVAALNPTIDFTSVGVPYLSNFDRSTETGLTVDGVQFIGYRPNDDPAYFLLVINPAAGNPTYWGTGTVLEGPGCWNCSNTDPARKLSVILPLPATAFALNLMTSTPRGGGMAVSLSNGWTSGAIPTPSAGAPLWFGLTSDTPFTTVEIRSSSGMPVIDNASYGSVLALDDPGADPPAQAAEATTMLLIGSALGALSVGRRFLRKAT